MHNSKSSKLMASVKCSLHQTFVLQEGIYGWEQVAQYYPNLMGHVPHCVPCDTCPVWWLVQQRWGYCCYWLDELLSVPESFLWHCRCWIQDSLHGDVFRQGWQTKRSHEVCSYYLWGEGDYTKVVTEFVGNRLIYFSCISPPLQAEDSCSAPCLEAEMQPADTTNHVVLTGDHILYHRITFSLSFYKLEQIPQAACQYRRQQCSTYTFLVF